MKILLAVATAFLCTPLWAEGDLSALSHSELVSNCVDVLDAGGDATDQAAELLSRSGFNLGEENTRKGQKCLGATYGAAFEFVGGRFVSPELQALALEDAEAKREAARQRELRYVEAVAEVCVEEYAADRFRALTTPICGEVFKAQGLPSSD